MDSKGGRGGAPARNAAGANASGKKRATRSNTAAQAQAAAGATGANTGGKKSNAVQAAAGGNSKPIAEKKRKNAAAQPGNQQQQQQQLEQQSDQSKKKKKKKRRLHAGAVAAKAAAAAAAAEVAATSSSTSPRRAATAGSSVGKPTVVVKTPRGGQLVVAGKNARPNTQKAAAQASGAAPTATPAPATRDSSAANNAVEKTKDPSLKPVKKKQKLSHQQQQATSEAPKQKQQHAQVPSAAAPGSGSRSKPKTKAKRKIDETTTSTTSPSEQVAKATATPSPKQTLHQPAAQAPLSATQSAVADAVARVAKKPKMTVVKRKLARTPIEAPSATAAGGSPAAAPLGSKQSISAPASKQDTISKPTTLAPTTASPSTTSGVRSTVLGAAPAMRRAAAPATTGEQIGEPDDAEKAATSVETQTTARALQTVNSIQSPVNSAPNVQEGVVSTAFWAVEPTEEQAKAEAAPAEREEATPLEIATIPVQPNDVASIAQVVTPVAAVAVATLDPKEVEEAPIASMQPSPPLSPERNERDEWMVNPSGSTTELEFEADEAFLQPLPALASSATDETNVLALFSPDLAEDALPPASTDSNSFEVATAPGSSTPHPSVETAIKAESKESSEALAFGNPHTDDSRQPSAEASSSTRLMNSLSPPPNLQSAREDSEEESKEHERYTTPPLPPPVPVRQARSKSGATLSKQTEANHSTPRNPIVEPRLRAPSKIEIPPPLPRHETNAWGASFGMAITPDHASASSSSSSSLQLLTSQTSPALATSPLSSWFLSKGHANFVQQVSFPPRSAQHHRRSLSPRKQISSSSSNSHQAVQAAQHHLSEPADDDDDDRVGSNGNAFLESLAQRSNWRSWYGNVDTKDLLDPPLERIPTEVHSAIGSSLRHLSDSVIASAAGAGGADDTESVERQRTKTRSIELLEAEIRAEKARARAFDQELLLMLQGGSALPSQ